MAASAGRPPSARHGQPPGRRGAHRRGLHADRRALRGPLGVRPHAGRCCELVASESVPFLPVLRYTDTGLRQARAQWKTPGRFSGARTLAKGRQDPQPAQVPEQGLPECRLLVPARRLDVPKGTLGQLPRLRARRRRQPAIIAMGRMEPPAAGHRPRRLLPGDEGERGWGPRGCSHRSLACWSWCPGWSSGTTRFDPCVRRAHGHVLPGFVNEEARALGFTLDDLRAWKPNVAGPSAAEEGSQPS